MPPPLNAQLGAENREETRRGVMCYESARRTNRQSERFSRARLSPLRFNLSTVLSLNPLFKSNRVESSRIRFCARRRQNECSAAVQYIIKFASRRRNGSAPNVMKCRCVFGSYLLYYRFDRFSYWTRHKGPEITRAVRVADAYVSHSPGHDFRVQISFRLALRVFICVSCAPVESRLRAVYLTF